MLGFLTLTTLLSAARKFAQAVGSTRAAQVIDAVDAIRTDIRRGHELVHDEATGQPMTIAEFQSKLDAWEAQQAATSQHAAERIQDRHAADGTGVP